MGGTSVAQAALAGIPIPLCFVAEVSQCAHDLGLAARIVARMGRWVSNQWERRHDVGHARSRPTAPREDETVPHRARVSRHRDQVHPPEPPRFSQVSDDQDLRKRMLKYNVISPSRSLRLTLMLRRVLPGPSRLVAVWVAFGLATVVTSFRIEALWATRGRPLAFLSRCMTVGSGHSMEGEAC